MSEFFIQHGIKFRSKAWLIRFRFIHKRNLRYTETKMIFIHSGVNPKREKYIRSPAISRVSTGSYSCCEVLYRHNTEEGA